MVNHVLVVLIAGRKGQRYQTKKQKFRKNDQLSNKI